MLSAAARTHAGRVRPQNEDALVCRPEQGIFAVIDGMGGEQAGEVAAAITAAAVAEVPNTRKLVGEAILSQTLRTARERILAEARANPACTNMGAVATLARLDDLGRTISIAHVGDTRAWLVSVAGVRQLTTDHVADAPEPGRSRPAVTRDLGRVDLPAEWVETLRVPIQRGDLLVLASDGLHDPVPEDELHTELVRLHKERSDADVVAARLVALALARGGPDNVTVVALRMDRYRRGGRMRRLGLTPSVLLLFVMLALLGVVTWYRRAGPNELVPTHVTRNLEVSRPAGLRVGPTPSNVADGVTLVLRGVAVTGQDWEVTVAPRGELLIQRSTVELGGALHVTLGDGATLTVEDSRVQAGRLVVDGPTGAAVVWRHATLPGTVLVDERLTLREEDVREWDPTVPGSTPAPGPSPTAPSNPDATPATPDPAPPAPR